MSFAALGLGLETNWTQAAALYCLYASQQHALCTILAVNCPMHYTRCELLVGSGREICRCASHSFPRECAEPQIHSDCRLRRIPHSLHRR